MDRQKNIPPLSTKITRKLAQESADHNSLMNFYSQISRDETGAPKKWKMTSPLHIDEESITSGRAGKSSNRPGRKSLKNGKKSEARDSSSSDRSSSRESSLESKDKQKTDDKRFKRDSRRSFSTGSARPSSDSLKDGKVKKKRGRPRSLDLSSKPVANGDDDNFKSPVPLTPCNIAVKRKKGRPKETPPVLVAETPLDDQSVKSDSDTEEQLPPPKKKPGRKPKNLNLKSVPSGDRLKSFSLKRFDGHGLKKYGSKLVKTGFRPKLTKLTKIKSLKQSSEMNDSIETSSDDDDSLSANKVLEGESADTDSEVATPKRKPGRPPGAKNKKYKNLTVALNARRRAAKLNNSKKLKGPMRRGPGKQAGPKSKQKPVISNCVQSDSSKEVSDVLSKGTDAMSDNEMDTSTTANGDVCYDAIDEAIDSVVFKARNNMVIDSKRDPYKTNLFYKKRSAVKSIAKFKKERDALNKMRQKRLLAACGTKDNELFKDGNLAKNDLRRKLQNKIKSRLVNESESKKEQLVVATKKSEWVTYKSEETKPDGAMLLEGGLISVPKDGSDNVKSEVDPPVSTIDQVISCELDDEIETAYNHFPKAENIIGFHLEAEQVNKVKKAFSEMTKSSDTESICSELSMNSLSSMKRPIEKQILILGEDNTDSDDLTVRTRQRFEIIPGKKRKRTLSGEFDLLDEKQLRKEKKKAEKGQTDDESEKKPSETLSTKKPLFKKRTSPLKISPTLKDGKIARKYVSKLNSYSAYRNRLLKQSPFLNRGRKRKRKHLFQVKKTFDSDTNTVMSRESSSEVESSILDKSKLESHRQGLFEKFTNDNIQDKELKEEVNMSYEHGEECEEMPVEETVDDSDTIDFHSVDQGDNDDTELFTESEIEVREILFSLIDHVIVKCGGELNVSNVAGSKPESIMPNSKSYQTSMAASQSDLLETSEKDEHLPKFAVNEMIGNTVPYKGNDSTSVVGEVSMNAVNSKAGVKRKTYMKRKVKMRKGKKLGPLPIQRRQNALNPLSTAIRKKPGRKPGRKPKVKQPVLTSTTEQPIVAGLSSGDIAWPIKRSRKATARKTSTSGSDSIGLIRTFELRQKISRSPLDNIALKQSIEENEYLKNEAQKASRKEAKLKSKLKIVQDINKDSFRNEMTSSDVNLQYASEEDYRMEDYIGKSIEEYLAMCKPCSVVLKDFIKELERAQAEGSCESETDAAVDSDEDIPNDIVKTNESIVANSSSTDTCESTEAKLSSEMIPNSENKSDTVQQKDEVKNSESLVMAETSEETELKALFETVIGKVDSKVEVKQKRKSPAKAKVGISPNKNVKISPQRRGRKPKKHAFEQQTARKTVPPLKIKLKGGLSSRRKTYMVEPHPDSPVEQLEKPEMKPDKKKEKSKTKSGNKSESSDSEKLGKHNHHKKRTKTPTDEVYEPGKAVPIESPEKVIRPTDAYEANFLQFIQDKDKVEQNIAAFSHSFSSKSKSASHVKAKDTEDKVVKNNALKAEGATNITDDKMENVDKDTEMTDVQYVCSQCDNVVYRAKEQIIQHYNEVHPGLQFIYKPLSESSSSDDLRNMRMAGNAAINEQQAAQKVNESTGTNNNLTSEDPVINEGDDDSGSLNLKIVDVVSLKDQPNILPAELPISKPLRPVAPIGPLPIQPAELRIPTYPIFSTGGLQFPGLTLVSRPPPSYPVAAQLTPMAMVQPTIARQPQPIAPEPAIPRHSPKQPGKLGSTFKCEKCNVHAPLLAAMVAHLRSVHKEIQRLFQCPYCKDLEAESEAMIHQHIKKTHPTNNPNPPVALSEPAKRNLKTLSVFVPEGMKMGEGHSIDKDIYMCLRCKTHMPSLDTIYDHLEKEHSEIFAYVCPVCKVFKSHSEDSVNNHIITEHRRSPFDVSVSLAIEGTHFTRVQCLVKDKSKGGQKASQKHVIHSTTTPPKHILNTITQSMNSMQESIVHATTTPLSIPSAFQSHANPITQSQSLVTTKPSIVQPVSKAATTQPQKKKKNLLESIEKLTVQKQIEQGIIPSKPSSVSLKIPSHPSQLSSVSLSTAAPPPPLLRAPPPLIRYDQLNNVTSAQGTMLSSSVRTSSAHLGQGGIRSQLNMAMLQKLHASPNMPASSPGQPNLPAKPIRSSLFDTSDLEPSIAAQRPVLNVPVVPRLNNKSPSHQGQVMKTGGGAMPGTPLDLSKTTPSPSPDHLQSASPVPSQIRTPQNPDEFKVFNLKPSTQMQLPRTAVPLNASPIMVPQQVRQNTPSTLAYRPPVPQINVNAQQIPQLISMPMGTVMLAPNMTQIFGTPNVSQAAQFLRMTAPQIAASSVAVLTPSQVLTTANQVNPIKNVVAGQQVFNRNTLFRCPYCPKLTPLRVDQVQSHIQTQHPPGSQILFMPFETK